MNKHPTPPHEQDAVLYQKNHASATSNSKRGIKSFVLRTGRMSQRQQHALDHWLKDYELAYTDKPWDLGAIFGRTAPVVVEIGFGMGQSLVEMAKANPENNYLGIEVHQAGLGSISSELHDQSISNVRVASFDAVQVFQHTLPDHCLTGIQIFFPDPWPKKRHHKRRLIQAPFLELLLKKLKPQGFIHVATDWEDYALHVLALFSNHPKLHQSNERERPLTKFEARGQRLGHQIWDICFYTP